MEKILQVDDWKSLKKVEEFVETISNKTNSETIKSLFILMTEMIWAETEDNKPLNTILWDYVNKSESVCVSEDKKEEEII